MASWPEMDLGYPCNLRCRRPGTFVSEKPSGDVEAGERLLSGLGVSSQYTRGPACLFAALRRRVSLRARGARESSPHLAFSRGNAHPPTSVLATLPLALLDYPQAGTAWNVLCLIALVASLALIARITPDSARVVDPSHRDPGTGLQSDPYPVFTRPVETPPLLLLLTLAWAAGRRGRYWPVQDSGWAPQSP